MCRAVVVSLVLLASAGCGQSVGQVSGQVLIDGKPLPAGRVTIQPEGGTSVSAELDGEGRFSVTLPVGEATASVDNREWAPRQNHGIVAPPNLPDEVRQRLPAPSPTAPKVDPRYVPIPAKYYQMESAGLSLTVKPGAQQWEMKLARE